MHYNKKLLIIEDEKNMRNTIKRTLKQGLPSVIILETGESKEALKIVEDSKPDLILLDVLMPNMNGLQVLKALKESKNREIRKIPVIMLTGVGNIEIASIAKKMGAVSYITKPFNEEIFLVKIKNYLV
ncbi:MAG: response regulator [Candidatus Helarchaeota archaeon]|nr:response regulator [Candidatus Helarchaeota archaeon]